MSKIHKHFEAKFEFTESKAEEVSRKSP